MISENLEKLEKLIKNFGEIDFINCYYENVDQMNNIECINIQFIIKNKENYEYFIKDIFNYINASNIIKNEYLEGDLFFTEKGFKELIEYADIYLDIYKSRKEEKELKEIIQNIDKSLIPTKNKRGRL